jgi:hypothetical protein
MKQKVKTGGKRLAWLLQSGKIDRPYLWIDTYNQLVSDIAGTIYCGVDFRNNHYVSVEDEQDNIRTIPQPRQARQHRETQSE